LRFVYWNGAISSPFPQLFSTVWRGIFWGGFFLIFYVLSVRKIYGLKSKFELQSERSGGQPKTFSSNKEPSRRL
jgi:hypothetical protein